MARTFLFLKESGIKPEGIRFRQHRDDEMAHYAKDCWDAEVETSYGWIEIAGHADRSCYDLTKHSEKTKKELVAAKQLKDPYHKTVQRIVLNKKELGKVFKKDVQVISNYIEALDDQKKAEFIAEFREKAEVTVNVGDDKSFKLNAEFVECSEQDVYVQEEKYTPSVIEPSFGIGRIVYCIFEHCFKVREEDNKRTYFDFPPLIAPVKCSILPLIDNEELNNVVQDISKISSD